MRIVSILGKGAAIQPIQGDSLAALEALGHELLVLPAESLANLAQVRDAFRSFQPDFGFFIANLALPTAVMEELQIPFASWFADNPFRVVDERLPRELATIFCWDRSYLGELKSMGIERTHWLPLAANPERMTPGPEIPERVAPLSFCADCGDDELFGDRAFAQVPGLKEAIGFVVEVQTRHPARTAVAIARQHAARSPAHRLLDQAIGADPSLAREIEICVQASAGPLYRRRVLLELAAGGVPLDVYGPPGWVRQLGGLPRVRLGPWLENGEELAQLYRSSTVNLNLTIPQLRTAVPMRVFDVLAAGGAVLSDWRADLDRLFEPGVEVQVARSVPEMVDLAAWLLRHPRAARQSARAGRKRVLAEHTFRHRMQQLVRHMIQDHDLRWSEAA